MLKIKTDGKLVARDEQNCGSDRWKITDKGLTHNNNEIIPDAVSGQSTFQHLVACTSSCF